MSLNLFENFSFHFNISENKFVQSHGLAYFRRDYRY